MTTPAMDFKSRARILRLKRAADDLTSYYENGSNGGLDWPELDALVYSLIQASDALNIEKEQKP